MNYLALLSLLCVLLTFAKLYYPIVGSIFPNIRPFYITILSFSLPFVLASIVRLIDFLITRKKCPVGVDILTNNITIRESTQKYFECHLYIRAKESVSIHNINLLCVSITNKKNVNCSYQIYDKSGYKKMELPIQIIKDNPCDIRIAYNVCKETSDIKYPVVLIFYDNKNREKKIKFSKDK